jgi:hypothetical protein
MLSRLQGRGLPFARRVAAPHASSHPVLCRALSTESPRLPFAGVRVFEKSKLLTGRLAGNTINITLPLFVTPSTLLSRCCYTINITPPAAGTQSTLLSRSWDTINITLLLVGHHQHYSPAAGTPSLQ